MNVIPLTIIGTGTIVTVSSVSKGETPDARIFIALAALWFFLSLLADTAEEIAKPLAILIFVVVLLANGSGWLNAIASGVKGKR